MEFSDIYVWVIIPLLILLARILDVTLGTVRVIFIARGMRVLAPVLGFFEVLIWLLAIGQIFANLSNPVTYVAYAAGFAAGNYIGIVIVDKLSLGQVILRIITRLDAAPLLEHFRNSGIGVTSVSAAGPDGPVQIIFSIIRRKDLGYVLDEVKKFNPNAFYSVEDVRFVSMNLNGSSRKRMQFFDIFRISRKTK
jgi:uncharacterized protein YebE (UPF0316 family)